MSSDRHLSHNNHPDNQDLSWMSSRITDFPPSHSYFLQPFAYQQHPGYISGQLRSPIWFTDPDIRYDSDSDEEMDERYRDKEDLEYAEELAAEMEERDREREQGGDGRFYVEDFEDEEAGEGEEEPHLDDVSGVYHSSSDGYDDENGDEGEENSPVFLDDVAGVYHSSDDGYDDEEEDEEDEDLSRPRSPSLALSPLPTPSDDTFSSPPDQESTPPSFNSSTITATTSSSTTPPLSSPPTLLKEGSYKDEILAALSALRSRDHHQEINEKIDSPKAEKREAEAKTEEEEDDYDGPCAEIVKMYRQVPLPERFVPSGDPADGEARLDDEVVGHEIDNHEINGDEVDDELNSQYSDEAMLDMMDEVSCDETEQDDEAMTMTDYPNSPPLSVDSDSEIPFQKDDWEERESGFPVTPEENMQIDIEEAYLRHHLYPREIELGLKEPITPSEDSTPPTPISSPKWNLRDEEELFLAQYHKHKPQLVQSKGPHRKYSGYQSDISTPPLRIYPTYPQYTYDPLNPIFKFFPKLLLEVRRMIWKLSLPPPKIIMLHSHGYPEDDYEKAELPVLLRVNKESRILTLEHYVIMSHYLPKKTYNGGDFAACIDIHSDSVSVNIWQMWFQSNRSYAEKILELGRNKLSKIKHIDFIHCNRYMWHEKAMAPKRKFSPSKGHFTALDMFHGLETATLMKMPKRMRYWPGEEGEVYTPKHFRIGNRREKESFVRGLREYWSFLIEERRGWGGEGEGWGWKVPALSWRDLPRDVPESERLFVKDD